MLKDIIQHILGIAEKHVAVMSIGYKPISLINAQNNELSYQFIIEDDINITDSNDKVDTLVMNIDVLSTVSKDTTNIEVQSVAHQIINEVLARVNESILQIQNIDIMTLSNYTDNNCSGVRATIEMNIPHFIDYCKIDDNFDDEKTIEPKPDKNINLDLDDCNSSILNKEITINI